MNSTQLLAHFDRISDAPDAIPCLRRFILDLTVRGKLVEQDPRDEPASELLKRIHTERVSHCSEGVIRRNRAVSQDAPDEIPFELPQSWAWASLGQVSQYGLPDKVDSNKMISANTWVLDLEDIEKDTSRLIERVTSSARPFQSSKTRFKQRDVLFGKLRPYLNKVIVADSDGVCTTEIVPARGFGGIAPEYIRLVLKSPLTMKRIDRLMYGMKMPRLGTDDALGLNFPLPPLNEQHRIVAKVDELMALCDRLETAQKEHEGRRDQLVASSLNRLNNGADHDAFRDHARFYFNNLPRLTTKSEHVKNLRGAILNLAFRGRLTSPWRETAEIVETAQEFIESVANARKKAWENKQVVGSSRKYLSPIEFDRETIPMIPDSWVWASADAVCSQITDGEHIQPRYQAEGLPMLTAKHVREGFVTFEDSELISESDFKKCVARCKPEAGDILVVSVGATTGRAAIVSQSRPFALVRSVLLLKPLISPVYFLRWLQSPWCFAWMRQASEASAQPHLYIGDTKRMPVPLPPLVEQQRIVATVDELMTLCDRLEAQLITTHTDSRRLLEAVLHEALAPALRGAV